MGEEFRNFAQLDICVVSDPKNRLDGISEDGYLDISLTGPQWESSSAMPSAGAIYRR